VALSVSPERLRGEHASVEHQSIAATAFTALVDALFISLIGIEPGGGLSFGAVILGTLGLTSSCGLAFKLWQARASSDLSRRWPYLLGFIIVVYAVQIISGIVLRTPDSKASSAVTFVYILFGVGIARSWELLGLEGGGPLDLLPGGSAPATRGPVPRPGNPRRIRARTGSDPNPFAYPAHPGYDAARAPVFPHHPAAPLLAGRSSARVGPGTPSIDQGRHR
jgi:hypothetical protein